MHKQPERPDSRITIPASYAISLCQHGPDVFVIATPSGTPPTMAGITAPGGAAGLFTHDEGVLWPNDAGVHTARAYLASGWPIALVFSDPDVATACHARLTREQAK